MIPLFLPVRPIVPGRKLMVDLGGAHVGVATIVNLDPADDPVVNVGGVRVGVATVVNLDPADDPG